MNHKFEDVEVKENGISLLEENLKRKRKKMYDCFRFYD